MEKFNNFDYTINNTIDEIVEKIKEFKDNDFNTCGLYFKWFDNILLKARPLIEEIETKTIKDGQKTFFYFTQKDFIENKEFKKEALYKKLDNIIKDAENSGYKFYKDLDAVDNIKDYIYNKLIKNTGSFVYPIFFKKENEITIFNIAVLCQYRNPLDTFHTIIHEFTHIIQNTKQLIKKYDLILQLNNLKKNKSKYSEKEYKKNFMT